MDKGKCEDCKFWEKEGESNKGLCRRYAKRPGDRTVGWPSTQKTDWCGEFENGQNEYPPPEFI